MRYLREIAPGLWLTDTRHPDSPYGTAFFHDTQLPLEADPYELPNRNLVFEFKLIQAEQREGQGLQAVDIDLVSPV